MSSELSEPMKAVAAALHRHLAECSHLPNLEVEMRLCSLALDPRGAMPAQPTILPRGVKITVGVTKEHFAAILVHLQRTLVTPDNAATEQTTEDIQVRSGRRFTYLLPVAGADAAATLVESLNKKRRFADDIKVPGAAYDLRLSASVEEPAEGGSARPETPPPPPPPGPVVRGGGYRRRKRRVTIADGSYRYDCTEVEDSTGGRSFEVEIEGVFASAAAELTLAWVEGLLARMTALCAVCTG